MINIPKIANITDVRYSWSQLIAEIERSQQPLLVVDRSRPKAVILPILLANKLLQLPQKERQLKKFRFRSYRMGKLKIPLHREYIYE